MSDIFSAISILLVFATVAFDVFNKKAQDFQNETCYDESAKSQIENKMKRKGRIIWELIFLIVAFSILFYIQLPTTVGIIKNSKISFWNFDEVSTFWTLINICSVLFIGLTIRKLISIIKIKN